MKKHLEKSQPFSCWNKATENERIFVLLERDAAAPAAIRAWMAERVRLGKNKPDDAQIIEAEICANEIERRHRFGKTERSDD